MVVEYDALGQGMSVRPDLAKSSNPLMSRVSSQFRTLPETTSRSMSTGSVSTSIPVTMKAPATGSLTRISGGGINTDLLPQNMIPAVTGGIGKAIGSFVGGIVQPYREEDLAREESRYQQERLDAKQIADFQHQIVNQEQSRKDAELQLETLKAENDKYFKELENRLAMQQWFDTDAARKQEQQRQLQEMKLQNEQYYAMLKAQTEQARERNELAYTQLEFQKSAIEGGYLIPQGFYRQDFTTPPDVLGTTLIDMLEQQAAWTPTRRYYSRKRSFKYSKGYNNNVYKEIDQYGIYSKSTSNAGYSY